MYKIDNVAALAVDARTEAEEAHKARTLETFERERTTRAGALRLTTEVRIYGNYGQLSGFWHPYRSVP